jgi:magnesium transporter
VKDMIGSSQSEIAEVLRKRDLVALREMLKNWSPSALVQLMTELATDEQMIVLRILPRELAAEAFELLDLPGKNGC